MSLHLKETPWTYEDYRQLPDDGLRYEVIDGKLYMSPAPSPYHQALSKRLMLALCGLETAGLGTVYYAPIDVIMPGATPVQPDLVYLRADQAHLVTARAIEGVPQLVVEVLSPSTASYDSTIKLNKYASAGVPHFWMVNPQLKSLMMFKLDGSTYRVLAALGLGEVHSPPDFPGLTIDMDALFQGIPTA